MQGSVAKRFGIGVVRFFVRTELGRGGAGAVAAAIAYWIMRGRIEFWLAVLGAIAVYVTVVAALRLPARPAPGDSAEETTNVVVEDEIVDAPGSVPAPIRTTGRPPVPFALASAALAPDHPAETVLRACADWPHAQAYVRDDLFISQETAASADEAVAARLLPVVFHAAAVMEEDTRRVRKWLREIENPNTVAELESVEIWQRNSEALSVVRELAALPPRRREELVRVIESRLRRSVDPLAQAIAPAIFTPEGVRRTGQLLKHRVFGQEAAIQAVLGRLEIAAAGLSDDDKPMGSFLFLGPTGVGKTEVARVLAEGLPDGASALAVFDMGQYKHEGDRTKLVGWTLGGIDSNRDGAMVAHLREHPYSVLVFDEIEKAHPAVFDLFLGMLDRARVQDQYGNDVSLADALVLFTSNVERDELPDVFRPEFLNRIDETIEFAPLTHEVLLRVFDKLFAEIREKVRRRCGIELSVTPAARDRLIELSAVDDARYARPPVGFGGVATVEAPVRELGARPLARVLDREVERRLAEAINRGEPPLGSDVEVAVVGDELRLQARVVARGGAR